MMESGRGGRRETRGGTTAGKSAIYQRCVSSLTSTLSETSTTNKPRLVKGCLGMAYLLFLHYMFNNFTEIAPSYFGNQHWRTTT